jgi:hypothetical protein
MTAATAHPRPRWPRLRFPVKLEDTGLPTEQVEQLLVKTLYDGRS